MENYSKSSSFHNISQIPSQSSPYPSPDVINLDFISHALSLSLGNYEVPKDNANENGRDVS